MAGYGKRLRPHTWSKPKPLVSVAGKTVLAHFLDAFQSLEVEEVIFIIGYLGEQVRDYIGERYPTLNARYVVQEELTGQSHAIWLAGEGLEGPALVAFVDTLIDADFSALGDEGTIWAKEVEDPRRFGVVDLGDDGRVRRLVEKPEDPQSNLAVVGFYYFPRAEKLIGAIERQLSGGDMLKGEYYLAEAINLLLEDGLQMKAGTVAAWNDCGTPSALLSTNRYLLDHGEANSAKPQDQAETSFVSPVYLDASSRVANSVIGPHVSIGPNCVIEGCKISDSIIESGTQIRDSSLSHSLIGRDTRVAGVTGSVDIGDNSDVVGSDPETC
jgi:glucose-1-phosphate thymidylyltransferase